MRRLRFTFACLALCGGAALAQKPATADPKALPLTHGLFESVQVYKPAGPIRQFVIMLSDAGGFDAIDHQHARRLAAEGAMVAGVSTASFYAKLSAESGVCTFASGAMENLSHHVQAFHHVPGYLTPMLIGRGAGAALAYATLAQGETGNFGPTVSLGFCPKLPFARPMCSSHALKAFDPPAPAASAPKRRSVKTAARTTRAVAADPRAPWQPAERLPSPWLVLQPPSASGCTAETAQAFVQAVPGAQWRPFAPDADDARIGAALLSAYREQAPHDALAVPAATGLGELPMIDVPSALSGSYFAVFLSGDGGWAGIDKEIAAGLVKRGVAVAGFDSLRYFWSPRTPEGLAADLERIIRHYAAKWQRSEVVLIGFSQGADVLPFALNRLSPSIRPAVKLTALLSVGQKASFEFHVANWLGPSGDKPIAPEAQRLAAANVLCVYGLKDKNSLCPALAPEHAKAIALQGSHHFDDNNDGIAALIVSHLPRKP